jgi:transcriptional regulator with XRE-family HTH domain
MSFLGEAIKARRSERGMSLQEVADIAGVCKAHVWQMERGRINNPTIKCLVGIATALQVEPTAFASLAIADLPPGSLRKS